MNCYKQMTPKVTCYCQTCRMERYMEKADYQLMLNREIDKRGTFKDSPTAYWIRGEGRIYA